MKDIVIGTGNTGKVFTMPTVKLDGHIQFPLNDHYWLHNIVQSDSVYVRKEGVLDTRLIVFKNTLEGREITRLINNIDSHYNSRLPVYEFCDRLILKHVDIDSLNRYIEQIKNAAYEKGAEDRSATIRSLLGLSSSSLP